MSLHRISSLIKYLETFAFVFIGLSRCYMLDFSIYLKRYHFTWRTNRVSWGNVKCFKRQKSELRMGSLIKISMWPRTCTWTLFKSVLSFFRALAWYIIDMSKICRYYKIIITCILRTYWRIAKNKILMLPHIHNHTPPGIYCTTWLRGRGAEGGEAECWMMCTYIAMQCEFH